MKKNKLLLILLALLAFGSTAWAQFSGGTGTEADPYQISSTDNWNTLATNVEGGTSYSNTYFKLMDNISVTTMVGTSTNSNKFSGIFDGDGHTLTFTKGTSESPFSDQYCAPFRYINGATIKNLKVVGTVTSSNKFAGGVVAHAIGSNTITNCVNSTIINATSAPNNNGSHGGILGQLGGSNNSITISGCLFNGQMQGSSVEYWCGFLGYYNASTSSNNQVTISNCFFNPKEINVKSSNNNFTICRTASVATNCYYNEEAAEMSQKQGKLARTITCSNDVTVAFAGNPSSNTTVGVIGYGTGIKYNNVLYAGNGDEVSLSLMAPLGYEITAATYTPEGGSETTINPDNDVYSFTMPNANVVVNATTTRIGKHFVTAGHWNEPGNWADNDYPTSTSDEVFVYAAATIPENYCAQADNITLADGGSLTIADGAQLKHSNAVPGTIQKSIEGYGSDPTNSAGWYLLGAPLRMDSTLAVNSGMVDLANDHADFTTHGIDLYDFNQNADLEWRNMRVGNRFENMGLAANAAYLYARANDCTLNFSTTEDKLFAPTTRDSLITKARVDGAELAGYNLINSPYTCNAYLASGRDFYRMNATGDAIVLATAENGGTAIKPCEGFFVVVGEHDPEEYIANTNTGYTMTARIQMTTTEPQPIGNKGMLDITVKQEGRLADVARVRFGNGDRTGKLVLRDNATRLSIMQVGKECSVVHNEAQGEMPVNFKAKENGTYTLTVNPEGVEMGYLHLIDNMTGADVDLLATPIYTFSAKTTDYESRFRLVFVCGDANDDNETFAFYSNGNWIIANEGQATLQVIDINGRILSSETVNGSVSKAINAVPGVYMIRLINGENVRVQKIVIP